MAEYGIGGGLNTFIPTFSAATGQIQVEFTRSVNRFPITQYAQIVPVQQMSGYYLRIDEEETARVVNTQDLQWPLGEDRPTGINSDLDWTQWTAQRFQSSFAIPQETARQAQWDVVASHARIAAAKMMTHRAYRMANLITTAGVSAGSETITQPWTTGVNYFANTTALTGGAVPITSSGDNVQTIIRTAIEKIVQNTVGVVGPQDIYLIVNPTTARRLAGSEGVRDYIKNTPHALNFLKGDTTFAAYGLPQNLFGLGGVVVDDTVRVSTRKGGANTRGFFYGSGMYFVSRPGGLVGNEGPSFSTCSVFAYEDMTVETLEDPWNRRIRGSVTDNSAVVITAPLSGLALADCTT
jgi:hypothetical protein